MLLYGVLLFMLGLAAQTSATFEDLSAQATAAREGNDVPHAIQLYKESVRLNPGWEEGWWFLGSLLYDSDRYAEGRDALKRVVDLDAKAAPAWSLLGLCEFETGDYGPSLEHIQRGLAPGSSAPQMESVLRYHEALLLTRTGHFDKALEKYAWFAKNGTQNPELLVGIGLAVLQTPLLPNNVNAERQKMYALAGTAAYLNMTADYRNAEIMYRKLIDQFPKESYVHYAYGSFLLGVNPDAGIQELERELHIGSSAAANAMLAFALLERGDTASALPHAQIAAQEQPDSELAQYLFGRALAESGDLQAGIQHLELAEKIDPTDLQAHVSLATAYSRAGRSQDSRRERTRSVELATGAARANP